MATKQVTVERLTACCECKKPLPVGTVACVRVSRDLDLPGAFFHPQCYAEIRQREIEATRSNRHDYLLNDKQHACVLPPVVADAFNAETRPTYREMAQLGFSVRQGVIVTGNTNYGSVARKMQHCRNCLRKSGWVFTTDPDRCDRIVSISPPGEPPYRSVSYAICSETDLQRIVNDSRRAIGVIKVSSERVRGDKGRTWERGDE